MVVSGNLPVSKQNILARRTNVLVVTHPHTHTQEKKGGRSGITLYKVIKFSKLAFIFSFQISPPNKAIKPPRCGSYCIWKYERIRKRKHIMKKRREQELRQKTMTSIIFKFLKIKFDWKARSEDRIPQVRCVRRETISTFNSYFNISSRNFEGLCRTLIRFRLLWNI